MILDLLVFHIFYFSLIIQSNLRLYILFILLVFILTYSVNFRSFSPLHCMQCLLNRTICNDSEFLSEPDSFNNSKFPKIGLKHIPSSFYLEWYIDLCHIIKSIYNKLLYENILINASSCPSDRRVKP